MKGFLEKIERLLIGIIGPLGGIIGGIIGAVYAYSLLDLSILLSIFIIGLGGILGLIWSRKFVFFFSPFLVFLGVEFEGDSWRSCLFSMLMLLYVLASIGMILFAFFDPTLLIWTAIIHGLYALCVVIFDPVNDEKKV